MTGGFESLMTELKDYDNIRLEDARDIYMYIEKNKILENYNFPERPGKDGFYRIYVEDSSKKAGRKQLCDKTVEGLKDKVYKYEKGVLKNTRKTFADAYEFAIEEKLKYVKDPEKMISRQNTVCVSRSSYKRYFAGTEFEGRFIDSLSKKDIEDIILNNLNRYDLREKAFNSMVGILRMTFQLSYEEYWIADNTFTRVNLKKFKDMLIPDVDIEKRVHSAKQVSKILEVLHEYHVKKPYYTPAWALELQIIIGARRGEIAPLRKSDVNDRYISITREQLTKRKFEGVPEHFVIVEHTKTYKNRMFPKTELVKDFMKRLEAMLVEYYLDSEYLFPDRNTELGVINNNTVYRLYSRICRKLGIKISREETKGTHSFRRNAITDVVNSTGGNVILASKLFGNSPAVACNRY